MTTTSLINMNAPRTETVAFPLPLFRQMLHLTSRGFYGPGLRRRPVIVNRRAAAGVYISGEQPDRVVFVHGLSGGFMYATHAYVLTSGHVAYPG